METSTSQNLSLLEGNHILNSISPFTENHMAESVLRILLILAGIEPNPGPKTWRCSVCSQVLSKNTTSVQCNGCNQWCHLKRCSALQSHLDWTTKYKAQCCAAASNALPGCFPAQIRSKCANPGDQTKFVREESLYFDPESSPYFTPAFDNDPIAINIENGVDVMENHETQFIGKYKLKIAKVVLQRVDSIYYTAGSERTNLYASKLSSYIKVKDGLVDMVSESRGNSTLNFIKDEPLDIIDQYSIKEEPPIDWKISYAPLKKEEAFQDPHCHAPLAMPSSTEEFTNRPAVSANNEGLPTDGRGSSIDSSSATVGSKICDLCGDIFRSLPLVRKHIVEEHLAVGLHDRQISDAKSNEFRLSQRGKSFTRKIRLQQHFISRSGEKPYPCSECGKTFMKKNNLMAHLRIHTGEKPYECTECGKAFAVKSNLTSHYRKHTGNEPYECTECGKKYREKWYLTIHQGVHSGEQTFVCLQCERAFATKSRLTAHSRIHTGEKPFECTKCGNAFAGKGDLTRHIRRHTGEKPFKCSLCEKAFANKSDLTRHSRQHTGEKPYKCTICGHLFARKTYLTIHIRRHTGEKPFKCSLCEKTFTHKSNLTIHFRQHTGESPYKCAICGHLFARKTDLTIHIRRHTGEKPFKCSLCEKAFANKSDLLKHLRRHTGEKPYNCAECGKKFSDSSNLKKHSRTHTGDKTQECL